MGSCQHVDCVYQGPRTAPRRVIDGETVLHYCGRHDPLKPATSADSELWDAVGQNGPGGER